MGLNKNKLCDVKDCHDEAKDILDCENVLHSFSVYMCLQHYMYFVSDHSVGRPIDLKPIDGHVLLLLHYNNTGGLLTKTANLKLNEPS